MSVNYAAGLSDYAHKGKCGQPEYTDSEEEFSSKVEQLVDLIKHSKHCVVLTGAGISTSTGIPDFRGPKGVWTLEEKGVEPVFTTTFDGAKASYAHMALVALEKAGFVKFLVTQNVDGLHMRSGFPRDRLSILHGDMFIEQCDKCSLKYIKSSCVSSMGRKYTGTSCTNKSKRGYGCRGKLRDTILDWEDSLPDDELDAALENSKKADVYLVLGSSLQIVPAGNLPLHCKKIKGKIISVNLQRTKHHKKTDIVIHSYIDRVMTELCNKLGVVVSSYTKPTINLHSVHCTQVGSCPLSNNTISNSLALDKMKNVKVTKMENTDKLVEDKSQIDADTELAIQASHNHTSDLKRKSHDISDIVKKELKVDT